MNEIPGAGPDALPELSENGTASSSKKGAPRGALSYAGSNVEPGGQNMNFNANWFVRIERAEVITP